MNNTIGIFYSCEFGYNYVVSIYFISGFNHSKVIGNTFLQSDFAMIRSMSISNTYTNSTSLEAELTLFDSDIISDGSVLTVTNSAVLKA